MKLSKILVPTDFSECADNALRSAIHLAKRFDSNLVLFHAIESAVLNPGAEAYIDAANDEESTSQAYDRLLKRIPELNEVPYDTEAVFGSVAEEVGIYATAVHSDLVIMGTRGVSGINEMLMGSNTHRVLRSLNIPVLVIPEKSEIHEVKSIVFAGDYKPILPELLEPIKMMAQLSGAQIHIVHISDEARLEKDEVSEAKNLSHYLKDYPHQYHMILHDDIEEGLARYCKDNHIDMLAMIPRKHSLFDRIFDGGETKSMVYHTTIPLLAIPEK